MTTNDKTADTPSPAAADRQFCRKGQHLSIPAVTLTFDGGARRLHWCAEHMADADSYRPSSDHIDTPDPAVRKIVDRYGVRYEALATGSPLDKDVSYPRVTGKLTHTPHETIDEDDWSSNDHTFRVNWSPDDQGDNVGLEIRECGPYQPNVIDAILSIESAEALRDALTAIINVARAGR